MNKTSRKEYVDILRSFALLYMLIYHIYIVAGLNFGNETINAIINLGGEIGVSIFFVLSGYSIYKLLEKKKDISYKDYILGRLKRIGPHYYISIFVALLFTTSVAYLGRQHLFNIFSHIIFIHNFFVSSAGAINGVLWTMGVIFQFYLLAPFIKKVLDKHPLITLIIATIISLVSKYLIFSYLKNNNYDSWYFFNYGQLIINTIEGFVLGMFVARLKENQLGRTKNSILALTTSILLVLFILSGGGGYI